MLRTFSQTESSRHAVAGLPFTDSSSDSVFSKTETVEKEVHDLARRFTNQSANVQNQNPFEAEIDGPLDPNGPNFRARDWAKAFYNIKTAVTPAKVAGVAFKDLHVFGYGSSTDYQMSVGNALLKVPGWLRSLSGRRGNRIDILRDLEGLVCSGEMLCVLGPPGSGCSTFLKTIAGDTYGFQVDPNSNINYEGIKPKVMRTSYRGEAVYTAEVDAHYPMLTVGDTLYFAALARAPHGLPSGVSREFYAENLRDVIMAMFGISHTINTRVGNDYVRGVSGGERKRVTIAEAALSYAPLQCWDNSTRGLDSANAVEFCKTLRTQSDVFGSTACVAIYQAPQAAYELFDKVLVLYEGRQIYFGKATDAREYFERIGFQCLDGQTTADFLTSMTSPTERISKPGFENRTPRTPDEFVQCWLSSSDRKELMDQIEEYNKSYPFSGDNSQAFAVTRNAEKSDRQRAKSPYTLSYWSQIRLCMWRELQRLRSDPSVLLTMLLGNFFEALIIASIFYNLANDTSSFFSRGAVLFMMILLAAFGSLLEILSLYAKRTIVEKHNRYALYHPSAEAFSSMIMDLPYKVCNAILVNTTLYFMANMRREAGAYFFFLLIAFTLTMSMSMFFRLLASMTKTIAQALAPSSVILLGLVLYTGFAIPIDYMRGWAHWIRYINPVSYGFESIMLNEFHAREFDCVGYIPSGPGYENVLPNNRVCTTVSSEPGSSTVSGSEFLQSTYQYVNSNRWRNFGIIIAFAIFLMVLHLVMSELVAAERSKGEVLVFQRGKLKRNKAIDSPRDEEKAATKTSQVENSNDDTGVNNKVEKQTSIFHWQNVCYEIKIKNETRTILDNVDGWVKPGTLTALMGVSGAGKTTLLDVLASRTTVGVISGEMLVDGNQRNNSFQRKTGYVQQQDLHLHTSTVREALEFSALLRQPEQYTRKERLEYVDTVIDLLNMAEYADAIVGVPGEGLNVEQRKRLTIGVELAARPKLLLFLDEPTSGLDSQTSWSICNLMQKLTNNGQAILCTIHQPSAVLFQRFDRLLLLAKGGRTVYFGEIGRNSRTLVDYFVRNGGPDCLPTHNPAEYMLEVIGAAPGAHTDIDWPVVWRASDEYRLVQSELENLKTLDGANSSSLEAQDSSPYRAFAAPLTEQFYLVAKRVFQQYWRTPSYIYSKIVMTVGCSLFIGFSFYNSENSSQGLQNQMFGVFIFIFVLMQLIIQIIPLFVTQRTLYEARERQSKTYDWRAFVFSNIVVEIFWNSVMAVFSFFVWYYPMGLWRNAEPTNAVDVRGLLAFLFIWTSFLFASTFAHTLIAGLDSDEVASALANILGIMLYAFCGILVGPDDLPGFWIFMYRINPFTYLVDGLLSTTLANAPVICSANEYLQFEAPSGLTCGEYMSTFVNNFGGYLLNPDAGNGTSCSFCQMSNTNEFLARINASFSNRWRNFGFMWVYIVFNIAATVSLYWLLRVPKNKNRS